MIKLNHITLQKNNQLILDQLSGTFQQGEMHAIIGPNGAGKSSLIHVLLGLTTPSNGTVQIACDPQDIGYLAQKTDINKEIPVTLYELVSHGLLKQKGLFKRFNQQDHLNIQSALEKVHLLEHKDKQIHHLSGGQLQRALFARLLLTQPEVIILDEPFAGVDQDSQIHLLNLLQQWHHEGKTIIAVLHDLNKVSTYFTHTLWLNKKILAWGQTQDVLKQPHFKNSIHKVCHHV